MSNTPSNLITATTTNASSLATSSITPAANNLILCTVFSVVGSGTGNQPTITGNGLTWVLVKTDTSQTSRRISVFRALGVSPSSGAVTADFGGQSQNTITISVDEIPGVDLSGTNGSGAIVQSNSNSSSGAISSISVTLGAFSSVINWAYGAVGEDGNAGFSVGAGFTQISQIGSSNTVQTQYAPNNQTTVSWSVTTSSPVEAVAIEIKMFDQGSMIGLI